MESNGFLLEGEREAPVPSSSAASTALSMVELMKTKKRGSEEKPQKPWLQPRAQEDTRAHRADIVLAPKATHRPRYIGTGLKSPIVPTQQSSSASRWREKTVVRKRIHHCRLVTLYMLFSGFFSR